MLSGRRGWLDVSSLVEWRQSVLAVEHMEPDSGRLLTRDLPRSAFQRTAMEEEGAGGWIGRRHGEEMESRRECTCPLSLVLWRITPPVAPVAELTPGPFTALSHDPADCFGEFGMSTSVEDYPANGQ